MRPSPPILQCLRPQCLLSTRIQYITEEYTWQDLWAKLMWSRYVLRRDRVIFDHCSKQYYWSVKWYSEPHFIFSSHQTRDLECFADSNNIPWNPPTIHCPDLNATTPQRYLLLLCALLFQQSHSFPICVVSTCNDSRKNLHKLCRIPRNCQCKWL